MRKDLVHIPVGILGKSGAGKGLLCKALIRLITEYNIDRENTDRLSYHTYEFSAPAKQLGSQIETMSAHKIHLGGVECLKAWKTASGKAEPFTRHSNKTRRNFLQQYAELMRTFDPYIWTKYAERVMQENTRYIPGDPTRRLFILEDTRLDVEVEWIKRHSGIVIGVRNNYGKSLLSPLEQTHSSEGVDYSKVDILVDHTTDFTQEVNRRLYQGNYAPKIMHYLLQVLDSF